MEKQIVAHIRVLAIPTPASSAVPRVPTKKVSATDIKLCESIEIAIGHASDPRVLNFRDSHSMVCICSLTLLTKNLKS